MGIWDINLEQQTATSINGITFRMTRDEGGIYRGECLNPMDIPPDDLDERILAKMIREAAIFFEEALKRANG